MFDALPAGLPRVISVGRLDLATEGLLLLTNDGELSRGAGTAFDLAGAPVPGAGARQDHPGTAGRAEGRRGRGRRVYGPIEAKLDKAKESKAEDGKAPANLWISVSITEGKNREVRKVLESVGLTVNRLIRLAYGPFRLDVLPVGAVEEVGPRVIRELLADYIRPENLPTGNTVETPAPIPGRRVSTPIVKGRSGLGHVGPVRGSPAACAPPKRPRPTPSNAASARPRRRGWAKAAPRFEHSKTFKPRERTAPAGDRPAREDGDRPKRAFKPRDDQFIDDRRKPAGARPLAKRAPSPARSPVDAPVRARARGARLQAAFRGKPAGPSGTSGAALAASRARLAETRRRGELRHDVFFHRPVPVRRRDVHRHA
ncbi:hypothetical protein [Brevundimonas sp.]|uniref:hypothetical protein n=1 Tax=Brevundimonas sp. TaxID=1871086 RepID=UPI003AFFD329